MQNFVKSFYVHMPPGDPGDPQNSLEKLDNKVNAFLVLERDKYSGDLIKISSASDNIHEIGISRVISYQISK